MAKLKYTSVVSGISGQINGSVFTSLKTTSFIRNKPVKHTTISRNGQTQKRYILALMQQWRTLKEEQRTSFNSNASKYPYTNEFGEVKFLSGYQLFISINLTRLKCNSAVLLVCPMPAIDIFRYLGDMFAEASPQTLLVGFTPGLVVSGYNVFIYATGMISPGVSNMDNKWKFIRRLAPGNYSTLNVIAQYNQVFPPLISGYNVGARVVGVNVNTGQLSMFSELLTTVV